MVGTTWVINISIRYVVVMVVIDLKIHSWYLLKIYTVCLLVNHWCKTYIVRQEEDTFLSRNR